MKTCRYCGTVNEDSLDLCAYCHASLPSSPDPEPAAEPKKKRKIPKKTVLFLLLAALIAVCAAFGVIWMRKNAAPADVILIRDPEKDEYRLLAGGKVLASYPAPDSPGWRTARSFRSADGTTTVFLIPQEGKSGLERLFPYCVRGGRVFSFGTETSGYNVLLSADGLTVVYQKTDGSFAVYRTDLRKETLTFEAAPAVHLEMLLHSSGNVLSVFCINYAGNGRSDQDYRVETRVINLKTGEEQTIVNYAAVPFGKEGKSLLLISEEGFSLRKDGKTETMLPFDLSGNTGMSEFALNAAGDEAFLAANAGCFLLYADGRAEKVSEDFLFPVFASSGYSYSKEIPSFENCFCCDVNYPGRNLYLLSKGKDGKSVSASLLSDCYFEKYENRIPGKRMAFSEIGLSYPKGDMTLKIASLSGAPVETAGSGQYLRYEMMPDEKALVSLETNGRLRYYRDGTSTGLAEDISVFTIAPDGTVVALSKDSVLYEIDPTGGTKVLMTEVFQLHRYQHSVYAAVSNPGGGAAALFYYDSGKLIPCGAYDERTY